MTLLLDLLYGLAVCLASPYLLYRRRKRGPRDVRLREYFGYVPSRPVSASCVWIHGVSLGEINAARTIVSELRGRSPETAVVISSTTRTGLDRARSLYAKHVVFPYPLDFSFAIRRLLHRIRPSAIVLMELEAWPNLIEVATARDIPVLIANGRVTERSVRRFHRPIIRWIAWRMFRAIRWVGAQDGTYASRFIELGVPPERVHVTGSVKYDAADTSDRIDGQEELAEALGGALSASRPVVDQEWLPRTRQVGKSGAKVKPRLYLALGISGAPEHSEGMKDADLIFAVNTDSDAPIFEVADYGVVADLMDIVPALTEAIQSRNS